ncbi:hypothetical protein BGZ99_008499 [Dissophora globulifera]|uniref:Uncharacterized protein n=1 Tax=Dissophora globulifera TaxID=979702 RepID=A0A9P6UNE2_9FUNG|nr:hypothetical protein BGZ99_008499 [Dissophora globulifera]
MVTHPPCHSSASPSSSWKRTLSSWMALSIVLLSISTTSVAAAPTGAEFFHTPSRSTTWYLGSTVNIRFHRSLSKYDSNNTMLYLEYTTRACQGSRPDEERWCDNRATKVSALGQISAGVDSFQWTIPTTLDLQLSRGKFHLYDYNGHTSESFVIMPKPRHYPRIGLVDQALL